jgi:hypothetical protein
MLAGWPSGLLVRLGEKVIDVRLSL